MTKDDLKRSLEQLFSDFAPPEPEVEREASSRDGEDGSVEHGASGGDDEEKGREHTAEKSAESGGVWRQGWQTLASRGGDDDQSDSGNGKLRR